MKIRTCLTSIGALLSVFLSSGLSAQEIPAGSILEARLQTPVSSYNAKRGDKLAAVLIAPVERDGSILLPAGTVIYGTVVNAKRVGIGLVRERARLRLQFNSLQLPDRSSLPIISQLIEVENAREKVVAGNIIGTRATNSYGHRMTGMVTSVASIDPLLTLFAFAGSGSILRFADAEITYPAGTELLIKLSERLHVEAMAADSIAPITTNELDRQSLAVYVSDLPVRTLTKNRSIPSDLTNLVFLGSAPQILEAFALAGWQQAHGLDPATKYRTVRAMAENRGYAAAPVSKLLLDGKPPALAFEKNLNTIDKRHHLRIWQIAEGWNGQTAWTAAATHDIGIAISKKRPIHKIDPDIDKERSKIVNDLWFAGCVDGFELVDRPRVPHTTYNATGDRVVTNGQVAVVHLRNCSAEHRDAVFPQRQAAHTGNFMLRGVRQFDLTMRNSLLRDNIAWQAYRASVLGWKAARHSSSQAANPGVDSTVRTDLLSPESDPKAESEPRLRVMEALSDGLTQEGSLPRLPELALSLDGGKFVGMPLGNVYLSWSDPASGDVDILEYPAHIESGALLGGSITLRPSKRISHQLFWGAAQANLTLGVGPGQEVDRLSIRTVGYQLEANLAPAKWRIRPFVTGGGNLTSYRFKNIKLAKKSGIFRYGLKGLGSGVIAFQSAGVAPLDGGKIFRPGFSYGGGMKFRVSRLFEARFEYRESYAKDPDFFNKESTNLAALGLDSTAQDIASRRRGNYIISLSFTP